MKFTDQLNNIIELKQKPKRIICLVPSITELLAYLKLDNEVVGITKFCIEPNNWFKSKKRIGGTKTVDIESVKQLKPDLIIANKEENDKTQVEQLQTEFNVWISNVFTLEDALDMIKKLGAICEKEMEAKTLNQKIVLSFNKLRTKSFSKIKAAYCIWDKPLMVAAKKTFINNMMQFAGFENVFDELVRYPSINVKQLLSAKPKVLLLSSEPFPFKEKHIVKYQQILPDAKIILVDGTMFSWYGSRLEKVTGYFLSLRKQVL